MGDWGYTTFENDMAVDWLYDLYRSKDPQKFLLQSLELDENAHYLGRKRCQEP